MNGRDLTWADGHDTIVIDGCDGTGKTTLAEELAARFGVAVHHSARTPDGIDLITWYQGILALPGLLILDRGFLSEPVYGPRYHGRSRLTDTQIITLAGEVADRRGICVHVTAAAASIRERLVARGEPTVPDIDEIETISALYDDVFAKIRDHVPVVHLDTT